MLGLKCHVIDALPDIGGQCTALYPEKPIYDIPGFPEVAAADLIANLESQARPFKPEYHLGEQIVSLSKESNHWLLIGSRGIEIKAKAVIIAGGAGAFGPNRPPLEGIEAYEGTSVFYMVRRKADFAGKRVVIAGGGDSAVDWALSLADVASAVYVVHRRDKFRAAPESVQKLNELELKGKISLVVPYQLTGLSGTNGHISSVCVQDDDGVCKDIQADILLPFFGLSANLGPVADWGLGVERQHIIVDPASCLTNIPGIYAIGDIVTYKDKLKLILTGFSEAAHAAHAIYRQVNPDKPLHMEYSTTKGLPGS